MAAVPFRATGPEVSFQEYRQEVFRAAKKFGKSKSGLTQLSERNLPVIYQVFLMHVLAALAL
jgi:hypothetical protein